jgi:hypothetical protein
MFFPCKSIIMKMKKVALGTKRQDLHSASVPLLTLQEVLVPGLIVGGTALNQLLLFWQHP